LDETPELNSLYDRDCIDVIAYGPEKAAKQTESKAQTQIEPLPALENTTPHASEQLSPSNQIAPIVVTPANSGPAHSPVNFFGTDDSRFHERAAPEKRRRLTTSGYVNYTDSYHGSMSSGSPGPINHS
jgi:hypothetical protein